ncbi:Receptor [Sparganum proliferum]
MENIYPANATYMVFQPRYSWTHVYCVSLFLGLLIFCIIGGNALVVASILRERQLRVVSNYLILSLSVADLLVATVVMPLSVIQEVSRGWWLGLGLCDLWICADVLLCTVSILHLCAIAVERYLAVTNLAYLRHRSAILVLVMVVICWVLSTMVSLPARFHRARTLDEVNRVLYQGDCRINVEPGYTIYSNLLAFNLPMTFMLVVYAKIYCTARKHIRKSYIKSDKQRRQRLCLCNKQLMCCPRYILKPSFNKNGPFFRVALSRRKPHAMADSTEQQKSSGIGPESGRANHRQLTVTAAAAAAMNMAATVLSTAQESGIINSPSYYNTETTEVNHTQVIESRSSSGNSGDSMNSKNSDISVDPFYFDSQPVTYEALSRIRSEKCGRTEVNQGMVKDCSFLTTASTIQFADATPDKVSRVASTSSLQIPVRNPQGTQRSTSCENVSSLMETSGTTARVTQSEYGGLYSERKMHAANFVPLSVFYRRRRQRQWIRNQQLLERKARETLKELSICSSDGLIRRPEEEQRLRARLEQKRERRAIRTVAIITGCFILCWLPFNLNALLSPFFGRIHPLGGSVLLWLGYLNSLLNPVIYTIFSAEFRSAFRKILCGWRQNWGGRPA